jgi:hypothetical protein
MGGNLLNFVAFQIGWLSAVIGAGKGWPFLGPIVVAVVVALHLWRSPRRSREVQFLIIVALLGTMVDSLLSAFHLVSYRGGHGTTWIAPAWITAMWLNFGTTIHASLGWLARRYILVAFLGAVAGPLAYRAAAGLGAVELLRPFWSLSLLALTWAVVLPLLFWLSQQALFRVDPS